MRLKIVAPEKAVPGRLDGTAQIFLDGRELKNVASIELSLMANEVTVPPLLFTRPRCGWRASLTCKR